ncbi:unnamed protein product [Blepharisma stoltei]|uniref:Uncharacterized protein n=1 Tax=Blepharisma stoltei TaxID=1481888 RepID=A0AAU9I904_9CILI|nr:unnamed protein product [Blepharisma stoltei]
MKSSLIHSNSTEKSNKKRKIAWLANKHFQECPKQERHLEMGQSKIKRQMTFPLQTPASRSFSVLKKREDLNFVKNETKSIEPQKLPKISSRSPEPFSPKQIQISLSTDSFESDFQKLELLTSKNDFARHNLLSIQQQIMELGVTQIIKERFPGIKEDQSYLKIEENIPHSIYDNKGIHFISPKKELFPVRRAFKLPPIC